MGDYSELKQAAIKIVEVQTSEEVPISKLFDEFDALASPETVLEILSKLEIFQKAFTEKVVDQSVCKASGYLLAKAEAMVLGNIERAPDQQVDQLKAEVARLTADNASLRGSCAKLGAEHAGMVRTVRKREKELDGLRKDAERYRWLRKEAIMFHSSCEGGERKDAYLTVTGWGHDDSFLVIDSAVDETIAKAVKP